jgi:hypothetical protein
MRRGPRLFRRKSRLWKSARWPRTTDGKKKGSGCRLRSDGRGSRPARAH